MRRMKRILALIVVLAMVLASTAFADPIEVKASIVTPSLAFSGTTAQCSVSVSDAGKPIFVTMKLYQGSTLMSSWSKSGTGYVYLYKTKTVTKGKTYTLKVSGTINGAAFTAPTITRTC